MISSWFIKIPVKSLISFTKLSYFRFLPEGKIPGYKQVDIKIEDSREASDKFHKNPCKY
jgi:hypothetical protein